MLTAFMVFAVVFALLQLARIARAPEQMADRGVLR